MLTNWASKMNKILNSGILPNWAGKMNKVLEHWCFDQLSWQNEQRIEELLINKLICWQIEQRIENWSPTDLLAKLTKYWAMECWPPELAKWTQYWTMGFLTYWAWKINNALNWTANKMNKVSVFVRFSTRILLNDWTVLRFVHRNIH